MSENKNSPCPSFYRRKIYLVFLLVSAGTVQSLSRVCIENTLVYVQSIKCCKNECLESIYRTNNMHIFKLMFSRCFFNYPELDVMFVLSL